MTIIEQFKRLFLNLQKCKSIQTKKMLANCSQAYNYDPLKDATMTMHNFRICQNFPTLKLLVITETCIFTLMMLLIINYSEWRWQLKIDEKMLHQSLSKESNWTMGRRRKSLYAFFFSVRGCSISCRSAGCVWKNFNKFFLKI